MKRRNHTSSELAGVIRAPLLGEGIRIEGAINTRDANQQRDPFQLPSNT